MTTPQNPPQSPAAHPYHGTDPYAAGSPYFAYPMPPPAAPPRRTSRSWLVGVGGGAIAAALVLGGVVATNGNAGTIAGQGSAVIELPDGRGGLPGNGGNGSSQGSGNEASTAQQVGIVTIVSVLKYQGAESAGTGMVLTSDGEVLTNNHVINGATSVAVTVESTDRTYRADVVGTAPGDDVAVLKLRNASGLKTAKLADTAADVQVGDEVTGVGNAGGTGTLTAASGKVTDLDQAITASDESGQEAEKLTHLIQVDAGIISGDSGGPLYDSAGAVIGMNTAASTRQASSAAYAIPIENATSVATKIESGVETTAIHIGYPGFLGISSGNADNGVAVKDLLEGGPAAGAGITPGSVITAIDGTDVKSPTGLRNLLAGKDPGSRVTVDWTDTSGQSHSAKVTLATGPAD